MHFWKGTSWTELSSCLWESGMNVNFAFNFPTALCLTASRKKEKHRTLFDGFFMLHETSQGFQTNASQIWFNQFWRVWNYSVNLCPRLPEHLKLVKPQSTVIYCSIFILVKNTLLSFPCWTFGHRREVAWPPSPFLSLSSFSWKIFVVMKSWSFWGHYCIAGEV